MRLTACSSLVSAVGVRAGELLERLGGEVLARAPAGRGRPLARRQDEPAGVLLSHDDYQRAAVELARALRAVEESPEPRDGGVRVAVVAVVVAQATAAAVLAGLGDVRAQLVDDEANAAGGDSHDPLPGLRVRRAVVVGTQQRVDERACDVHVCRVHDGQVVEERVPKIEVDAVRVVGQLAQLCVAFALRDRHGVGGRLADAGGRLLLRRRGGLGLQVVVGALDRGLGELAVQRAVDDDRPPRSVELDQHASGTRPVDVGVGEPDLGRAVGVAVELLVQLLGLNVELLGLLAQAQLGDLAGARAAQGRRRTPCRCRCGLARRRAPSLVRG